VKPRETTTVGLIGNAWVHTVDDATLPKIGIDGQDGC